MSQSKSLIKNTIIYAVGNFGSKLLSFILLPLYSYYLNKSEFGLYDLFISAISFLVPFITLQTADSAYRWLIDSKKDTSDDVKIISNAIILVSALFAVSLILLAGATYFIHLKYFYYFAFILITSCYFPFFQSILRGLYQNKKYSVSGIINTLFILVLNVLFLVVLDMKLISLFISTILANIISILYIILSNKIFKSISIKYYDKQLVKSFIKYSLPLVPNTISWWLINLADKFLILKFLTIGDNGIYAVSSRFPSIIAIINAIFLLAWQDHSLTSKEDTDTSKFRSKVINQFITFELSVVIILISITPYIIKYFLAPEYNISSRYVPFLYIGVAYSAYAAYIAVGYQKIKKTKQVFFTTFLGGILNILISLLLLKRIGLYAPALGTFISFLAVFIVRKIQTDKFYRTDINILKLSILTLLSIGMAFSVRSQNDIIRILSIALALVIFIGFNLEIIKKCKSLLMLKFLKQ